MKEISKLKLPKCPYCGSKLWYMESFLAKNKKTFKCKNCLEKSDVLVNPDTFKFLGLIEVLSVLIFAVSIFLGGFYCFLGLSAITVLFSVFYAFSPFCVRLVKCRNSRMRSGNKTEYVPEAFKKRSGKDTDTEIFSN